MLADWYVQYVFIETPCVCQVHGEQQRPSCLPCDFTFDKRIFFFIKKMSSPSYNSEKKTARVEEAHPSDQLNVPWALVTRLKAVLIAEGQKKKFTAAL